MSRSTGVFRSATANPHTTGLRGPLLYSLLALGLLLPAWVLAQTHTHSADDRKIVFPDVDGYLTLKCDFHMHTVFSDGSVWPTIRVQEALRDGLDAVSLTEHLEYQPYADDIPHPDRNRSHDVAVAEAGDSDLIVIRGSEITRSMPPGHANAIFTTDNNKLLLDDPVEVFREAKRQGAFIFWNHPHWTGQREDGVATLTEMHQLLIDEDLMHGVEVINHTSYSQEALRIALERDITIVATSDIHGLVDWAYEVPQGGHRPIMLVFSEQRSEEGIKEALFDGRTVGYFNDLLVGKTEYLLPLLEASIQVVDATYPDDDNSILEVHIENRSSAVFILRRTADKTFQNSGDLVALEPHSITTLEVRELARVEQTELDFEVLNATVAPGAHLTLTLPVVVE